MVSINICFAFLSDHEIAFIMTLRLNFIDIIIIFWLFNIHAHKLNHINTYISHSQCVCSPPQTANVFPPQSQCILKCKMIVPFSKNI